VGNLSWKKYTKKDSEEKKNIWWGSQGSLYLTFKNPDYVILKNARFIPQKHPNESWLEVTIENLTKEIFSVNYLIFKAWHDWGIRCGEGDTPNAWQEFHLNWRKVLSGIPSVTSQGTWTKINDEEVLVRSKFRAANCGNYSHDFVASVPLQVDLKPNTINRISLKFTEIPFLIPTVPSSLQKWQGMSISIDPDEIAFPKVFNIEKLSRDILK
jgi:hypothetical protein